MTFECADAVAETSLMGFDVVFLAALVGVSQEEKTRVLGSLVRRMKRGVLVVVRSACGVRGLLYPALKFSEELRVLGLQLVLEVRPWNHVVNSTLIMKVTGGDS